MDLNGLIYKHKNKVLNISVIILAFIIATNIYKKQVVGQTALLKDKKQAETKVNEVLESISQLEKRMDAYKNLLAKKDVGSLAINTLGDIAKKSSIQIVSIRPEQEYRYEVYANFPFDVVIRASSYHALGKFLSIVESYRDVYVVDSLEIRADEQIKELTVNLRINSVVF